MSRFDLSPDAAGTLPPHVAAASAFGPEQREPGCSANAALDGYFDFRPAYARALPTTPPRQQSLDARSGDSAAADAATPVPPALRHHLQDSLGKAFAAASPSWPSPREPGAGTDARDPPRGESTRLRPHGHHSPPLSPSRSVIHLPPVLDPPLALSLSGKQLTPPYGSTASMADARKGPDVSRFARSPAALDVHGMDGLSFYDRVNEENDSRTYAFGASAPANHAGGPLGSKTLGARASASLAGTPGAVDVPGHAQQRASLVVKQPTSYLFPADRGAQATSGTGPTQPGAGDGEAATDASTFLHMRTTDGQFPVLIRGQSAPRPPKNGFALDPHAFSASQGGAAFNTMGANEAAEHTRPEAIPDLYYPAVSPGPGAGNLRKSWDAQRGGSVATADSAGRSYASFAHMANYGIARRSSDLGAPVSFGKAPRGIDSLATPTAAAKHDDHVKPAEGRGGGGSQHRTNGGGNSGSWLLRGKEDPDLSQYPLHKHAGRIYELCRDQHGCRYLQKQLEENNPEYATLIFNETLEHMNELMVDSFGNYLCQRLFEYCSDSERTAILLKVAPELVRISFNTHGTRAVQKIIENLSTPEMVQIFEGATAQHVVSLIKDLNGNHVIQKCLNQLGPDGIQFIINACAYQCVTVGTHRHGCCVIQRCLDSASPPQKQLLIGKIVDSALDLVQNAYGNYVVQYILDLEEELVNGDICSRFRGSICSLSVQKFSSNVVEKCIRVASPAKRAQIIDELMSAERLQRIIRDSFGNYVVQTALEQAAPEQRRALCQLIMPLVPSIHNNPHGRRVASRVVNLYNKSVDRYARNSNSAALLSNPYAPARNGRDEGQKPAVDEETGTRAHNAPPRRSYSYAAQRDMPRQRQPRGSTGARKELEPEMGPGMDYLPRGIFTESDSIARDTR